MEVLSQKREADRVASRPSPPGLPGGPGHPPLPVPLAAALSTAIPAPPHPLSGLLAPGPSVPPSVPPPALHGRPSFSPLASIYPPTPHTSGASWYHQPLSQQNEAPPAAAHSRPSECLQRERPKDSLGLPRLHSPSEGAPAADRTEKGEGNSGERARLRGLPHSQAEGPGPQLTHDPLAAPGRKRQSRGPYRESFSPSPRPSRS